MHIATENEMVRKWGGYLRTSIGLVALVFVDLSEMEKQ